MSDRYFVDTNLLLYAHTAGGGEKERKAKQAELDRQAKEQAKRQAEIAEAQRKIDEENAKIQAEKDRMFPYGWRT